MTDEVLLDTNVILRLLRADQPAHHTAAVEIFERARDGKIRLLLPSLVVAEVVFVLSGVYRVERAEIAKLLRDLFASPNVILLEPPVTLRAVEVFGAHNIDFVDAYLAALAEESGVGILATFNRRDFRRSPHLTLVP